jgi:hypothetical protein
LHGWLAACFAQKAEPHPVTGQGTELKAISVQAGRVALDGDRTIRRWEFRAGDIARYWWRSIETSDEQPVTPPNASPGPGQSRPARAPSR